MSRRGFFIVILPALSYLLMYECNANLSQSLGHEDYGVNEREWGQHSAETAHFC